jgi:hypothetical protein
MFRGQVITLSSQHDLPCGLKEIVNPRKNNLSEINKTIDMTDQNDNLSMEDILKSLTRERFHRIWEAANAGKTAELDGEWRFRTKSATDSAPNRPPIPFEIGHRFRSKSAGHSDPNRPPH